MPMRRPSASPIHVAFAAIVTLAAAPAFAQTAAPAAPVTLPPLVDPASRERHTGKMIFVQLVTPDLAGARQFYSGLFGWTFRDVPGTRSPYAVAYLGTQPVAGVLQRDMPQGQHRQPAWLSFFSVPDVDAAVKTASDHGAKLLGPARDVPGLGREAMIADPQGAVFGIMTSSSGDPPDVLTPDGDWIWRSLMTSDPKTDAAFYTTLLGYETFTFPPAPGAPAGEQHLLLASEHYARATANTPPRNRPDLHPHWLDYVRVDNAGQAVAKAVSLGGHVLVEPRPDRHGGMIAVVADPQGAPVGLFEWADTETKELAK